MVVCGGGWVFYRGVDWARWYPLAMVERGVFWRDTGWRIACQNEFGRRVEEGRIDSADAERFMELVEAAQKDRSIPWDRNWGGMVQVLYGRRLISKERLARYMETGLNAVEIKWPRELVRGRTARLSTLQKARVGNLGGGWLSKPSLSFELRDQNGRVMELMSRNMDLFHSRFVVLDEAEIGKIDVSGEPWKGLADGRCWLRGSMVWTVDNSFDAGGERNEKIFVKVERRWEGEVLLKTSLNRDGPKVTPEWLKAVRGSVVSAMVVETDGGEIWVEFDLKEVFPTAMMDVVLVSGNSKVRLEKQVEVGVGGKVSLRCGKASDWLKEGKEVKLMLVAPALTEPEAGDVSASEAGVEVGRVKVQRKVGGGG